MHLKNEPVVARPPSAVSRLQKGFRPNKVMAVAGTGILAALVIGLGVSLGQEQQQTGGIYATRNIASREEGE